MTATPTPSHVETLLRQGEAWVDGVSRLDDWTAERRADALVALQACPLVDLACHVEVLRLAFADARERNGVKSGHVRTVRPPPDGAPSSHQRRPRGLARFLSHQPGDKPTMPKSGLQAALSLPEAPADPTPDLLPPRDEQVTAELREHEERIAHALRGAYLEVGRSLRAIRDARTYRAAGYSSFETYTTARWDMEPQTANRIIAAASAAEKLEPIGSIPIRESHVRPLLALESDDDRATAWRAVLDEHPDGHITARDVEAVVRAHMGIACEVAAPPPKPAPPPVPPAPVSGKGRSRSPLAIRTDRAKVTDVQPVTARKATPVCKDDVRTYVAKCINYKSDGLDVVAIHEAIEAIGYCDIPVEVIVELCPNLRDVLHQAASYIAACLEAMDRRP